MSKHLQASWREAAATEPLPVYLHLPDDKYEAVQAILDHTEHETAYAFLPDDPREASRILVEALDLEDADSLAQGLQVDDDGFTVRDYRGDAPTTGYMVSYNPSEEVVDLALAQHQPDVLLDYFTRHEALKNSHPDNYYGAWVHKGHVYLDISQHIEDFEEAKRVGIERDQIAIRDLAARKNIVLRPGA